MNPKAFIAMLAAAAIAAGFALPGPPKAEAKGQSQLQLLEFTPAH